MSLLTAMATAAEATWGIWAFVGAVALGALAWLRYVERPDDDTTALAESLGPDSYIDGEMRAVHEAACEITELAADLRKRLVGDCDLVRWDAECSAWLA